MSVKSSRVDNVFHMFNILFVTLVLILVLYPLYFVVIASFSDPAAVKLGKIFLYPLGFNTHGYEKILQYKLIWIGYRNTILYTVVGTTINVGITILTGYALSIKNLPGRNAFMGLMVFTMFFSGGMIPTFLFVKSLGLYNSFWVMIVPGAMSVWNMIIARTFFQSTIPNELREAAFIDGCSEFRFFMGIVLPLSKAIISVLVIYYAVGHWNSFFSGLIYLRDEQKFPLQIFLRQLLLQNQFVDELKIDSEDAMKEMLIAESMKYGLIIVSSVPILILYPFVQKYFIKGVMIGAIKG